MKKLLNDRLSEMRQLLHRTILPSFKTPDIKRISRHLKSGKAISIETYFRLDEDGDYVAKSLPCPFLGLIIIAPFMK